MASSELVDIFDAITGGNSAERFLSTLAGDSPTLTDPALAAPDLPIPTPAFDMPVVAAQASLPLDTLPLTASLIPSAFVSHQLVDTPCFLAEYSLPGSAVTGSNRSNSNSTVREPPIHKKKRTPSHRTKKDPISRFPLRPTPPNVSFTSDVSAITPNDEISASCSNPQLPPKSEPSVAPDSTSLCNPKSAISSASLPAHSASVSIDLSPPKCRLQASPPPTAPPKSHTRKCREKVTRQFENLLEVLPSPPRGVEVKHKAQILDYTINVFKDLLIRRTSLQAEIALASRPALLQWINNVVASSASGLKREAQVGPVPLSAVLEPFVGLYCVKNNWAYGEMWLVDPDEQHASLSSCVFNSDNNRVLKRLDAFAAESRKRFQVPSKLQSGIVSRSIACHRPEWLEQPASDPSVFSRAEVASSQGICLVETVPIVMRKNRCAAVLLFADVKPHAFSTIDMSVAREYAEAISEGYIQYLQRMQQRCTAVHGDGRLQPKPICSTETKPGISNQLISTESPIGSITSGLPGLTNGVISQTEMSSRFFSDSDLMARRCF